MEATLRQNADSPRRLGNPYLGPGFSNQDILDSLGKTSAGTPVPDVPDWKQGRHALGQGELGNRKVPGCPVSTGGQSIGNGSETRPWRGNRPLVPGEDGNRPRALGNRSILARPDDRSIKDRLNILLKKRVWYQPFCPSMLIEDASALLELNGHDISV